MGMKQDMEDLLGQSISFGADIGTSSCFVAYKERDMAPRIPVYPAEYCKGGVPSLSWRDRDGNEWFCDQVERKQGLANDPAGVWTSGKMKLDQTSVVLNGHAYTPRYLMIKQVQRVLELTGQALDDEMVEMDAKLWVVGVPVRFSAAEHRELQIILQDATGGATIRLVAEPILAAIANDYYTKKKGRKARRQLVLDIGGGTLDVVMLIPNEKPDADHPEPYLALNPDGLRVAGDYMDEKLEEVLLEEIKKNPGTVNLVNLNNKGHYDRRQLRQVAKDTKERLSSVDSCAVTVTNLDGGKTVVTVTRQQYEAKIMPMMKEAVALASDVLKRCDLGANPDIDILLVGGGSYTPLLRTLLEKEFSWLPKENIMMRFPERAVALGAAIYAETPQLVRPKIAYGYAVNTHIDNGKEEVLRVIIPSAADLPMTVKADFVTMDANQASVRFTVYEVPNTDKKTHMKMEAGRVTAYSISHKFATRVPKDTPVKLTTTLTEDGVLDMTVEDFRVDQRITHKVFTMNNTISN